MHFDSRVRNGLFTLLLSLFLGCSHTAPIPPPPQASVTPAPLTSVVKVHDGDTLTVVFHGTSQRVRLAGIDCPESDQPYGAEATEIAKTLALNREVTVTPITTDRYGRTVAEVTLQDGRSLNRELVKAGACWWFRKYAPNDVELKRLEREARTQRLGVWATESPVSPWEWRAQRQDATKRSLQN
jgi:micrococcal nuclease